MDTLQDNSHTEHESCPFLSQTPQLIIVSTLFPQKILQFFCWCCFLLWCQSTLLWQKDTTCQGRVCFLLCVCVFACVCTRVHYRKKMLAHYPATGIKPIYPQVWNLLFPKLFGENECLYLITSSSISISLQFGKKICYCLCITCAKISNNYF